MMKAKGWGSVLTAMTLAASVAASAQQTPSPVSVVPKTVAAPASTDPKAVIDQEIRAYLLAHPEILIEMSQLLQSKQQQQMMVKASQAINDNAKALAHDPQSPVAGNLNGNVTVVEFFDYQCPHCKAMVSAVDGILLANKNVRVVYKEMPIFGAESEFAAKAALAASKQGKYQAFHRALMKTEGRLSDQQILDLAKSVGLDVNKLQAVMNTPEIAKELQDTGLLAQKLGLQGTPAFIVLTENGAKVTSRFIPGQTTQPALQQAINEVSAAVSK